MTSSNPLHSFDGLPKSYQSFTIGFQHIIAMLFSNIGIIIIIGDLIPLSSETVVFLIQMSLLTSGLVSLVQVFPIWKIGSKLPLMMGTSVIFLSAIVIIGKEYGLNGVFGSIIVASVIEIILAFNIKHLRDIFTPIVNGIVIISIGVTLFILAIKYNMSTIDNTDFSLFSILFVSFFVIGVTFFVLYKSNQTLKVYAFILSIIGGLIVSSFFGMIDISLYNSDTLILFPEPLKFGLSFPIEGILLFSVLFIVSALETIADTTAITKGAYDRYPRNDEYQGSLLADGVGSMFSSILCGFPKTTYTQNVGIVIATKVVNKWVIFFGAAMLILLSFFPPFGSAFVLIPKPVISGFFLSISLIIILNGYKIIKPQLELRTYTIISITIVLAIFLYNLTDIIGSKYTNSLFVSSIEKNGILLSGMLSLVLEQSIVLYKKVRRK